MAETNRVAITEVAKTEGQLYWLWDGDTVVIGQRRCATLSGWGSDRGAQTWGFDVRCFRDLEFCPDHHFDFAVPAVAPDYSRAARSPSDVATLLAEVKRLRELLSDAADWLADIGADTKAQHIIDELDGKKPSQDGQI